MRLFVAIDIGFVPLGWLDVLDIALVAFLVYQIYRIIRGTLAVQLALVLLGLYGLDVLVQFLGLTTLRALFGAVSEVFVLAVIILFAPEIRRLLFMLGNNPLVRRFVTTPPRAKITSEIVAAIAEMMAEIPYWEDVERRI